MKTKRTQNGSQPNSRGNPKGSARQRPTSVLTDLTGTLRMPQPAAVLERFSSYLREQREESGLSMRKLARLTGVPHTNIHQYERRKKNPRLTELAALSLAFNKRLSKFLKPLEGDLSWKLKAGR